MEEAGVVAVVRVAEVLDEARVDPFAVHERLEEGVVLDATVFADAEEDEPVNRALDREVELADGEARVAEGDVPREHVAPLLDFGKEGVVNRGRAFPGPARFHVVVERASLDGVGREEALEVVPAFEVVGVAEKHGAGGRGFVGLVRLDAAVVDRELLEVGEERDRELGGPGVAAELERGACVFGDAYGRFLGLGKEDAAAADAECVVRGLGCACDLDGLFVDDRLEDFGQAGFVGDVPTERLEEGVEELGAELFFFVVRGQKDLAVPFEPLDEVSHQCGRRSSHGRLAYT